MVSAGLDTVPGNLIMGLAYLSSAHGQEIQQKAYDEMMRVYPNGDAWEKCLLETKLPYMSAFVKEVLRFFTVIPICLPRQSIKDIAYEKAVIPAGTTFYMVFIPLETHKIFQKRTQTNTNLERIRGRLRRIVFQRPQIIRCRKIPRLP
jgi:cytochrome P450